jgi:hypothetical protein
MLITAVVNMNGDSLRIDMATPDTFAAWFSKLAAMYAKSQAKGNLASTGLFRVENIYVYSDYTL